jgi:hypothetical protein
MNCAPMEYSQFFYIQALTLQTECANRLGYQVDSDRYR